MVTCVPVFYAVLCDALSLAATEHCWYGRLLWLLSFDI